MKKSVSVLLVIIVMITLATVSYAGPPPGKPPKSQKIVLKKSIDQSEIVKTAFYQHLRPQEILDDVGKYDFIPGSIHVDQQPGDIVPATMAKMKPVKSLSFFGHEYGRTGVKKIYRLIRPPTLT
jgi:hypothetical protein